MPFKFVNWLFEQKGRNGPLGELAKTCLTDRNFPIHAKLFDEILEYFILKKATKEDLEILHEAWNEFRILKKVKVKSLNIIKSRIYGI